jgi:hypothetical protein
MSPELVTTSVLPRSTGTKCEVALKGRTASARQGSNTKCNDSSGGNRVPRATRTRSAHALGLGQTIEAGVQLRLNPMPALWWAIEHYCSDPQVSSDREDPESLGVRGATAAPSASTWTNGVLKASSVKRQINNATVQPKHCGCGDGCLRCELKRINADFEG